MFEIHFSEDETKAMEQNDKVQLETTKYPTYPSPRRY